MPTTTAWPAAETPATAATRCRRAGPTRKHPGQAGGPGSLVSLLARRIERLIMNALLAHSRSGRPVAPVGQPGPPPGPLAAGRLVVGWAGDVCPAAGQ